MEDIKAQFSLDYGTKPTTMIPTEPEHLKLDADVMLKDYAQAYTYEMQRRNPLKYEAMAKVVNIEDELNYYFRGLLRIRVESVIGRCKVWRQAKELVIPAWIQFTLRSIGRFVDYDYGIYIIPDFDFDYDIQRLLDFSHILESFKQDGISLFKDAFPRDKNGDKEVMSMSVVGEFVKSMTKEAHPIASYVNAFVGAKISETCALQALYRVRYDDITFIKEMLINDSSIY